MRQCLGLASALMVIILLASAASLDAADELPLVRVPAPDGTTGPMILLLTGDGDWAAFPKALSAMAAARGAPVLGLKMRSYLSKPRTPDETAAALAPVVRAQLAAWNRTALLIVGYSRGADIAPFVVNRWPEDLRSHLTGIAFVGLSEHASFEFHLNDLLLDIVRPTDLPTRPEVEKLVGTPMWCMRGADEENSFCDHPVTGMQVTVHPGSHRATGDPVNAQLVLHDLGLER
jgi:type IV secretory pathway VirJ component